MKIKGIPKEPDLEESLGPGGEMDLAFFAIPMNTYKIILDQARKENITVAQVVERSLETYIINSNHPPTQAPLPNSPKPDFVVKRKR